MNIYNIDLKLILYYKYQSKIINDLKILNYNELFFEIKNFICFEFFK